MRTPIKHDKSSKHRKSKSFKSNIAIHPFVIFAITAALTLIIFLVLSFYFGYLFKKS
ncbi:MAG: hypothetical protein JST68_08075 [Bacteroidetes bacterium]|nr:hypothetical protein [Bacteroidota bacterium]